MAFTIASTPSMTYVTPSTDEEDPFNSAMMFSLVYRSFEYTTSLSIEQAIALDRHKAIYVASLAHSSETPEKLSTIAPNSVESLVLRFFQFLLDRQVEIVSIKPLIDAFQRDFLIFSDIHSVIASLPEPKEVQKALLGTYYATISRCGLSPEVQQSALLKEAERGNIKLIAVFGGQGSSNPRCFRDLQDIYETYAPFLNTLITSIDSALYELCRAPDTRDFFSGREISLQSWLKKPDTVPDDQFLATAAVSFPIHGAISLAHWCVVCKVLGRKPGDIRSLLAGVTGHSQGVIAATAISGSDSWPSFYENAKLVTKLLFWLGYESHQAAPRLTLSSTAVHNSKLQGEGQPTPMLHVHGLVKEQVVSLLAKCNQGLPLEQQVYLALSNSRYSYTIAGPASSLARLNMLVRDIREDNDADQSRIPFDKRKPHVETQFLPISAPFHTPYLETAARRIKDRLSEETLESSDLLIPIYHTQDGSDMARETNILASLIDAVTIHHVDWPSTLNAANCTHVLAFGRSLADMIANNTDGKGVKIISGTELTPVSVDFGSQCDIFTPHLADSFLAPHSWEERFRPQLAQSENGSIQLKTKMTKLLGVPPIMVAGMTPTTVHWDFVSAIMNAGYHAELAGGGYFNAQSMSAAITQLSESVPPGRGITCNLIYVSPQAMAWQIAMLRQLARTGRPIDGLTIGAGVPSLDVASEYITSLGLRHISFKPGSEDAIERVLEIAKAHPDFPVIIQWTGGRGGGHHSFEDFHSPILRLYGKLRRYPNVVLVAGSGFGDAAGSYPYLTGSWSLAYGYPPMPFDGILLGSRMMVAKEAHTSLSVKRLICDAPGTNDAEWTKGYSRPVGGVVTVKSEMGQPIHKIATRGVLFWKEMDELVFSLPRAKQLEAIKARKDYIIRKLNDDFAKPWFGCNSKGDVVDLSQMTYLEILSRLISLMYLSEKQRWIDPSYSMLVRDFAVRTLERFGTAGEIDMDQPDHLETLFRQNCPEASSVAVHPEDVPWFLNRCKRRGQKPVNFVPVLDEDFSTWMKKDSLWQSEDIEAVVGQDPGRVCILQGPVAVQHSQRVDESAADILNGINDAFVEMLKDEFYRDGKVPPENTWESSFSPSWASIDIIEHDGSKTVQANPGRALPSQDEFFKYFASQTHGWLHAIFASEFLVQGRTKRSNFLRQFFQIDEEKIVEINETQSRILLKRKTSGKSQTLIEIVSPDGLSIATQIFQYHPGSDSPTVLHLNFEFDPNNAVCPLSEDLRDRNSQIKSFYNRLWLGSNSKNYFDVHSTFGGYLTVLSPETLQDWISSIGLSYSNDRVFSPNPEIFPLNATIIPAWEALVEPLMIPDIDGDLLRLVHLSIEFQLFPGASPLRIGETVKVTSQIESIVIDDRGKTVTICAIISRGNNSVVSISSKFLIQGSFADINTTFRRNDEPDMVLKISSSIDDTVLRARPWLVLDDDTVTLVGKTLLFRLGSFCTWKSRDLFDTLRTTGEVFIQDRHDKVRKIGNVDFEATDCHGNPVVDFLTRKGKQVIERHELENPGWAAPSAMTIKMPSGNDVYAKVSKDYNPIHVSPIFATLANLPGTIVHGMYTSAVTSSVLDQAANDFNHLRTRRYSVSFVDMVLPGEAVQVKYRHIAMIEGRLVIQIQAFKTATGDKVLEGEVELEQVPTAYVFTGQGSQAPGMGMELYKSSPVAKKIWNDIDRYLLENYGWSILNMVQENPKRLTIHFSGNRGRAIRDRYLAMAVHSVAADGQVTSTPLLPNLTPSTRSFTFEEPKGLLYATQFAQPAITVLEKVTFEVMRANGLVQEGALFAGHSLGEYGALACLGEFIPFQDLMDVAYYRGLTMQMAVDRDDQGATDYSMVAVNPGRVNKAFDEAAVRRITGMIATESKELLEIVNFNVEGEQYVCAGHNANLYALTEILNKLSKMPTHDIALWMREIVSHEHPGADGKGPSPSTTAMNSMITTAIHSAHSLPKPILLTRGQATIPLSGIDVPFHSSHLRSGVASWRKFLLGRIRPENVQPDALESKFVPNVMGRPFSLEREYIAEAMRLTGSEALKVALEGEVVF